MIKPAFEKFEDGLIPVVVQDFESKEVVMHAYINEDAWEKTLELGLATFWSRSREELWTKGLTSGNTQKIKDIFIDCDRDTLLFVVDQVGGAACHLGYKSCFFRKLEHGEWNVQGEPLFDPKEVYKK